MFTQLCCFEEPFEEEVLVCFVTHYLAFPRPHRAFLRVQHTFILCFEEEEPLWQARRVRGEERRRQRQQLRMDRVRLRQMTDWTQIKGIELRLVFSWFDHGFLAHFRHLTRPLLTLSGHITPYNADISRLCLGTAIGNTNARNSPCWDQFIPPPPPPVKTVQIKFSVLSDPFWLTNIS